MSNDCNESGTAGLGEAPGSARWKSCAEWQMATRLEVTVDEHDTQDQADGVCKILERDGLGGDKILFPLRTWVEAPNMPLIDDADLLLTDPPYGINADAKMAAAAGTQYGTALAKKRDCGTTNWDASPPQRWALERQAQP
jgi:hypothetical protein